MSRIYLEDIEPGAELVSGSRAITTSDIETFVELTGDDHPLHVDAEAVGEGSPYEAPIAHGLLVTSISSGQPTTADGWALGIYLEESRRFIAPVYAGDQIRTLSVVTDVRRSRSKPDRGIVTMEVRVLNQHGDLIQEGVDVVLVGAREVPPAALQPRSK